MSRFALDRLTAIVDAYELTGEPSLLFDGDLPTARQSLAATAGDRGPGRQVVQALARLHWYRYLAMPGVDGIRERQAAVDLYRMLFHRDPAVVPEPLRDECRDSAGTEPDALSAVLLSPQQNDRIARLWQRREAGDPKAVRMLVDLYREWVSAEEGQPESRNVQLRAALLTDLSDALIALGRTTSGRHRYDDALDTASKALAATTAWDPHRPSRFARRGRLFELYFDEGAGPTALERAVDDYRRAAQLGWHRRPADLNVVARLGSALFRLYELPDKASVAILLEATAAWRDVVVHTHPDDPQMRLRLTRLEEVGNVLANVIGYDAVNTILTAAQEPGTLNRLLRRTFDLVDGLAFDTPARARAAALESAMMLAATVPGFDPDRPAALLLLAEAEHDRWASGGELGGAARAMTWAQSALDAAGPEHPLRREALSRLASAAGATGLQRRSQKLVDLALNAAQSALELADEQSDDHAAQLGVLAEAYAQKGALTKDPEAVDEAVRYQRLALDGTPAGQQMHPVRLAILANFLAQRDELVPDDTLLAEAVEMNRRALAVAARDDPGRVKFIFNLATTLMQHAVRRNDPDDLLAAERMFQDTFALLPPEHPDHPRTRSSIAEARYHRYLVGGDIDVLASAVELARQALGETPAGRQWWSARAHILARAAAELARVGGPDAGPARAVAIATYAALAASPVADPQSRIEAERHQAELAGEAADPAARLAALDRAVRLMPAVASRSAAGRRRLAATAGVGGLASEAAAAAVDVQDLDAAVELLERGRGLLFNEAMGIHTAWAELRAVDPRLAAKLDRVDRELSTADAYTPVKFTIELEYRRTTEAGESVKTSTTEWDPGTYWLPRTRELAIERARLVERIRALPGFADLLLPPSLPVLRERLRGLPIVMVNTRGDRGDALLIPAEPDQPVELVRLPDLREAAVRERVTLMYSAVLDATDPAVPFDRRVRAQEDLLGVLAWLWDAVTGPVLDRIAPVGGPVPRIWWCPVGILARLPLHAAGHHREPGRPRTVLDRTVSSYTPTLTALAHAMTERPRRPITASAVVVGVPGAGQSPALSEVRAEIEHVARLIPGSAVLSATEVAPEAVEDLLRVHPIAHFACHGEADASANAMLIGGLRLGAATLSPHMVRSYRLHQAELAFLSACSTAETHPRFTDEPLHLASAFQLAGFHGVIGTMWRTADSARIAESFYGALTGGGSAPPDTAAAARALTETVRAVRDEFPKTPTRWAGYVHVGLNRAWQPSS